MVSGVQLALLGEGLLSLGLGALVLWRGLDRTVSLVFALYFGIWAVLMFLDAIFIDGLISGVARRLYTLLFAGLVSLTLAVMAVYPPGMPRQQKRRMLYLAALPVMLAGLGAIVDFYPAFDDGSFAFLYFILTDIGSPVLIYVPGIWFLWHAYRAQDGPRRMQFAGAAAAMMIWTMNDGLPTMLNVIRVGDRIVELNAYTQILGAAWLGGMVATMTLVALLVVQAARGLRSWGPALTLCTWTILAVGLAQLQGVPERASAGMTIHLVVDMATFLILFYFVARYQVLDVALARPSITTRGVAIAIGLTALIATQVMLEQTVGSAFGWLGAILAGAAVAATIPLQQRLERARIGPSVAIGQYEAFRRMQIYHAAVEGAMLDDKIDGGDNRTLANLRRALDITTEDHERLLGDLAAPK